jgi:hypothetical protein
MTNRRAKIGFGYHLTAYLAVNAVLIWINLDIYPQYLWFKFPLTAWTIIMIFHAWRVFSKKQIIEVSAP